MGPPQGAFPDLGLSFKVGSLDLCSQKPVSAPCSLVMVTNKYLTLVFQATWNYHRHVNCDSDCVEWVAKKHLLNRKHADIPYSKLICGLS